VAQTFRSHSEETSTKAKIVTEQPGGRNDRVSCEVNSIGATGAKPPLLGRTTVCIGARIVQAAQRKFLNGSDYAVLPSSLPWPYQIFFTAD